MLIHSEKMSSNFVCLGNFNGLFHSYPNEFALQKYLFELTHPNN